MADRTCTECGHVFRDPSKLRRHKANVRPCAPIVESPASEKSDQIHCKYCGRPFATKTSMYRHIRQNCKIANSEEGMEKLFEHTLQRQNRELQVEVAEMKSQMDRLANLLEQRLALAPDAAPQAPGAGADPAPRDARLRVDYVAQVNTGVVNNIAQQNNTIIIKPAVPWDGERRISVSASQIAAAFEENARLKEYVRLDSHQMADPAIAPQYVTELLMDLTKRAHTDPTARNVYLNPKRADQALVHMTSGTWAVVPLQEATRLIFDGVAKSMMRVTLSSEERRQLPLEAQNALATAGLLYDDEPEEYAKKARSPMAAHLANTVPQLRN